ncbi:hypothetical protein GCM10007938_08670 [Vibrio zhanjiangensis]|uniref:Uncharacterized protein n=1 Tax=Vibrio zhanjiangensis TaxID=1046128 RepID=A0ABQ6EX56_9VIBR|nr:hypothetical protein GCM10007938_08670 [Vibrio zhanjiangensis]
MLEGFTDIKKLAVRRLPVKLYIVKKTNMNAYSAYIPIKDEQNIRHNQYAFKLIAFQFAL